MKKAAYIYLFLIALLSLSGCRGTECPADKQTGASILQHSRLLAISGHDGYEVVTVYNPWDTNTVMGRYILVAEDCTADSLPDGDTLRVPLTNMLVFSNVHVSLLREMGAISAVGGVCDASYITDTLARRAIDNGRIADCGTNTDPSLERVAMLAPDAIMLSPYSSSDAVSERLERLSVPVIYCADYMEATPLARAEWMRFYGRLVGKGALADSIFEDVSQSYENIRRLSARCSERPSVLVDSKYGSVWYVPANGSTTDCFIRDAGGSNPFSNLGDGESIGLSSEEVLLRGGEADVWLLRYFSIHDMDMDCLAAESPEYSRFKAFRTNRVYGCNTAIVPYYDLVPFHPHLLLSNLVSILHPGLTDSLPDEGVTFFSRLPQ